MLVVGMGEKKTPKPFITACDKFKYLEILAMEEEKVQNENEVGQSGKQEPLKDGISSKKELLHNIKIIVNDSSDEDGWVNLSEVGNKLNRRYPDFDTRNYGYTKLSSMIKSLKQFDTQPRRMSNSKVSYYIKNKE